MDIKTFKVERWMDDYETKCKYNLAETCIDSLTVREVVEMAGLDVAEYMNELADTRLTYSHIGGSPDPEPESGKPLPSGYREAERTCR